MNGSRRLRFVVRLALCLVIVGVFSSCATRVDHLPSGPITISGDVSDATGLPLANATIRLYRHFEYVETVTDANGRYAFNSLAEGSYFLRPKLHKCDFIPSDVHLDHVTSNTVQDFGGSGPGCGGERTVNVGAMAGPLIISGHIRDAAGQPIVGARVDLDDDIIDLDNDVEAVRFTDLTGGYAFHVEPDDYAIRVSGSCSIKPKRVYKHVKADLVQDFVAKDGCITAVKVNVTATGSVLTLRQDSVVLGTTYVHLEQRATAAEALARLSEIAAEQPDPSRSLTIAGNPAIERQALIAVPGLESEEDEDEELREELEPDAAENSHEDLDSNSEENSRGGLEPSIAGGSSSASGPVLALTTAIAVGGTVVRFDTQLSGQADAATIARFLQAPRNFTPDAVPDLHGPAPTPLPTTQNTPPGPAPVAPGITVPGILAPGTFGEIEAAASDTANAVVYGTQNGPFVSTNGGQNIKASTYNTAAAPPNAAFVGSGDPTVAVGSPNATFQQTIYFAQLQTAIAAAAPGSKPTVAIGLYQSTDNGQTFNLNSFPVNCSVATAGCVVPDQEHLAADRVNRAVTAAGSFDQLYLTWRNFTSATTNAQTIGMACSADGGANWRVDLTTIITPGATFPRLSVGPNGSVIVAYSVLRAGGTYALTVQKFTSCANGFQPTDNGKVISPVTVVKSVTEVTDMPGLDRAPLGNYWPAFDDSDGSAKTIFLVYANEASSGNDDIHVTESRDGGTTWTRDSIINTVGTGRRYFPWICSTVGKKFVTWYDRRNSSGASPDLTAFYRSMVFDNGSASSVGTGPELSVSGVDDPQCAPGFVAGVSSAVEQSQCTNLPAGFIPGGTCQAVCPAGTAPPCGSGAACDFRATPQCAAAGETCTPTPGLPKYGDYNGSACALGTLFTAWASSTPPLGGAACVVNGLPSAAAASCCSGILVGGTCAPSGAACTANGGACGPGLQACCSGSINGQCQAGTCLPAITMYTGSSCLGPGCAGLPVKITYHQTGACNGFPKTGGGVVNVGPNQAYVIFGIERIDNSLGTTSFAFDPAKLFVQQATQHFLDSSLQLYPEVLGPFSAVPTTLTPGQNLKFSAVAQGAAVVITTNVDGAVEANQTAYFLLYNRAPTDPPITLVKSDAGQTSWPLTQNCKTIALH
jgi:carboxypeptidase family protein